MPKPNQIKKRKKKKKKCVNPTSGKLAIKLFKFTLSRNEFVYDSVSDRMQKNVIIQYVTRLY